jgi:adenylosuccinate synthase
MGDEGKGRFTNLLAGEGYAAVARFNGGANAGHTFEHNGEEINTHQIPSGITYGIDNYITNSSLVDPVALIDEMRVLERAGIEFEPGRFIISASANLVLPLHIMLDEIRENGAHAQGSTKRGIRFAAADKYQRDGVTAEQFFSGQMDVVFEQLTRATEQLTDSEQIRELIQKHQNWANAMQVLAPFFGDTVEIVHSQLDADNHILAEGAQSSGLDIEHGIHGEGTSSHVTVGGVLNSLGVGPHYVREVFGVAKLIKSRVGGTPESFPTRIEDEELAAKIRGPKGAIDSEYGKSTGRARMVGWLDLAELRQTKRVNGLGSLIVTKLDCVSSAGETVKIATHYEDANGEVVEHTPTSMDKLRELKPVYQELPTWNGNIQDIRRFRSLPGEARDLIKFISAELDLPVSMIGVGPNKEQTIDRRRK